MFDIGFSELLVVTILALLVLGPERLPKAARTAGLMVGRFRRMLNGMQEELERQVRTEELREKLKDPYATFELDAPAQPAERPQPSASAGPEPLDSAPPKS